MDVLVVTSRFLPCPHPPGKKWCHKCKTRILGARLFSTTVSISGYNVLHAGNEKSLVSIDHQVLNQWNRFKSYSSSCLV